MARFSNALLNALVAIALLSSVLTAGVVVRREFFSPTPGARSPAPVEVRNWERFIDTSRMLGTKNAPLQLVEFGDYQCPACRQLHELLLDLDSLYPATIAVTYRHFPLPMHARAYTLARAAECAADQGRFEPFHHAIFGNFAALDTIALTHLAAEAQLPNLTAFEACAASAAPVARIDEDLVWARDSLRLSGTPAVLVNGKAYSFAPHIDDLRKMIDEAREPAGLPLIPHPRQPRK